MTKGELVRFRDASGRVNEAGTGAAYEFNYYRVKAGTVLLGYELLRRPVGTRKWEKVKNTQDKHEADRWCEQGGHRA